MTDSAPWLTTPPEKPGVYHVLCDEMEGEEYRVIVIRRQDSSLWVIDFGLGTYPIDLYHFNLINIKWRESRRAPRLRFKRRR